MFASKVALCEVTESMILDNRSRLITASLQLAIEAPSPILISVGFCRDHRWRFCLSGEQTLRFANLVTGLRILEPEEDRCVQCRSHAQVCFSGRLVGSLW
jgi:hypothetical protein